MATVRRKLTGLDLVGVGEAKVILDVKPSAFARWLKKEAEGGEKRLPTPVAVLGIGPIWLRKQIEELKAGKKQPAAIASPQLDLVGTKEAAEILDLPSERIAVWRKNGLIPEPVSDPKIDGHPVCGPMWWRPDIVKLKPERERRRRGQG